jgi:chromosome segregation ATPase
MKRGTPTRDITEIQEHINDLTSKIDLADTQLAELEKEMQSLTESNVSLVEANLHRQRKSPSLTIQREKMFKVNQQMNELKMVKDSLQGKLSEVKKELGLAKLYRRVLEYKQTESAFMGKVDAVKQLLVEIDQHIRGLKVKTDELKAGGHPLYLLSSILKEINENRVGMKSFMEEGAIEDPNPTDKDYLATIKVKYRLLQTELPEVANLNVIGNELLSYLLSVSRETQSL